MTKIKSLAVDTAIYGIPSIIGRFINFLLVPLYTYKVIVQDYGIVANLYAWIGFVLVFLTFGMETGFFRFASEEGSKHKIFGTSFGFVTLNSVFFLSLLIFFKDPISRLLHYESHIDLMLYTALIVSFDAVSAIPFAKLRLDNKATLFAGLRMTNIVINIACNLVFFLLLPWLEEHQGIHFSWFNQDDLISYIFISNLAASFVTLVLVTATCGLGSLKIDKEALKSLLSYSTPILFVGLAGMVNMFGDRLIYPFLFKDATEAQYQLGIYSANYKIGGLMVLFTQAFRYAYEPFIFNNRKNIDSKEKFGEIMTHFVWFGMLIVLGVSLFLPLIQYFIGSDYRVGLHIVPFILFANLVSGIFFNLSVWYKLTDKTRFGAYFATVGSIVILLINISLVPKFGYVASAWATLASNLLMVSLSYGFMRKYYKIHYNFRRITEYLGLAVVLIVINNLLVINSDIVVNIVRILTVVLYVGYYIKRENLLKLIK